jgi:hypothetical protein
VSFGVAYGWDIVDEWCLIRKILPILKVEKFRVDGVVTEPFLLPFANQIQGPSQRSFGKSLSAFTFPNIPARISGNYILLYPYVGWAGIIVIPFLNVWSVSYFGESLGKSMFQWLLLLPCEGFWHRYA